MNSDNLNELAAALAKAQAEMKAAEMDKVNPHFKSKYASLASMQAATRPMLAKNGLSITQVPQCVEGGLILDTWLLHSSGQYIKSEWPIPAADIQKLGSYLTYVKRYAWSSICGIAGDEDDDGNAAQNGNKPEAQQSQIAPPKPEPKPEPKQAAPAANGNGTPGKDWPTTSGPVFEFCQEVRKHTNYYTSQYHLSNSIGGFGNPTKPAERQAKLEAALAHAASKQDPVEVTPVTFNQNDTIDPFGELFGSSANPGADAYSN